MNRTLYMMFFGAILLSQSAMAQKYRVINKKNTGDTTTIYRNGQLETFTYVQEMPVHGYDLEEFIKSHTDCPPE